MLSENAPDTICALAGELLDGPFELLPVVAGLTVLPPNPFADALLPAPPKLKLGFAGRLLSFAASTGLPNENEGVA